jgi:ABC-type lipoprotein release transport system permease subunit
MGQQQLLLVILVTIIVGIATVVAINIFGTAAEQANKDAVRQDLLAASAQAQGMYSRPEMMGGLGNDFSTTPPNDEILGQRLGIPGVVSGSTITNENAVYTIDSRTTDVLTLTAAPTGSEGTWTMTVTRNTGGSATTAWTVEITDGDGVTTRIGQDNS